MTTLAPLLIRLGASSTASTAQSTSSASKHHIDASAESQLDAVLHRMTRATATASSSLASSSSSSSSLASSAASMTSSAASTMTSSMASTTAAPLRRVLAKAATCGVAVLLAAGARELLFVQTSAASSSSSTSRGVSGFALEADREAFRAARRTAGLRDSAVVGVAAWPFDESYASMTRVHAAVDARGVTLVAEGSTNNRLAFVRLELNAAAKALDVVARCALPECQFVRFGDARGTAVVRRERDGELVYVLPSSTPSDILRRVVLYEGAVAAERLCALNDWPLSALHAQALELGLVHRLLDVFIPTLRSMSAEQQESVAVPLVLNYLQDVGRTRADPEFSLQLVAETMKVLSARIASLLQAGEAATSTRVVALAGSLRTLRGAQREAVQIAAAMSRVGSTAGGASGEQRSASAGGERSVAMAAAVRALAEAPVAVKPLAAGGTESMCYRVAAVRHRRAEQSAWPLVVADVCRAAFDALVDGDEARAVVLLDRLGADVQEHAAALAMYVSRVALRERLLALAGDVQWSPQERAALAWLAHVKSANLTALIADSEFAALYSTLAGQRRPLRSKAARRGIEQPAARSLGGRVGVTAAWLAYDCGASDRDRVLLDVGAEPTGANGAMAARLAFARDRLHSEALVRLLEGPLVQQDAAIELARLFGLAPPFATAGGSHVPPMPPAVQQLASETLARAHRVLLVPHSLASNADASKTLDAALHTLARANALFRADDALLRALPGDRDVQLHRRALQTLLTHGSTSGALLYAIVHRAGDNAALSFPDRDEWPFVRAAARIASGSSKSLAEFALANARHVLGDSTSSVAALVGALVERRAPLGAVMLAYLAAPARECDEALRSARPVLTSFPALGHAWRVAALPPTPTALTSSRGDVTFASLLPALANAPRVQPHVDAPDIALALGAGAAAGAVARLFASRTRAQCDGAECERRSSLVLARYAALTALDDDAGVGASLAFAEWVGGADAAHVLRVDIVAARRIVEWRNASADGAAARAVAHLFLQFGDTFAPPAELHESNKPSSPVFRALRQLEDATLALTLAPAAVAQRGTGPSLWSLVTSFCHAHALPLSTGHLCELAQANDWVGLLHEAQTQHFPLWQVRDIVRRHVASPAVRAHILCALRDRSGGGGAKRDNGANFGSDDADDADEDDDEDEDDEAELAAALATPSELLEADHVVFDALLSALDPSNERPGESLLGRALQAGSVTLAVLATCFADVRTLDCVVVFLFAAQSKLLAAHLDRIEIPSSLAQLELCVAALLNADDGGVGADAVYDALALLCPQCPLRHYVDFHRAVRTSRLDVAQPALAAFVAGVTRSPALVSDDDARAAAGSGVALSQPCAWQQRVACDAALALLASLGNEEERALALQLLAGAELAPRFATLRVAVDIVRECRVPVPWSELCGGEELAVRRVARERALGAARRLARCFELHALADRIACREADHLARSLTAKRRALACIAVNNVARLGGAPSPDSIGATPARVAAVQQLMPFMSMSKIESGFTPARVKSPPPAGGAGGSSAQAHDPTAAIDAVVVDSGTAWHWQRCSQLLVDAECAAAVGGDWFLEKVGSDTRRVEQLWLMREALAWYKGERGGVDGKRAGPSKPRQLVSQLEMRIMFAADELADAAPSSSVEASSSSSSGAAASAASAAASASSDRVPRSLVNVVGRLLQRGDVSQARALCRQYQYESVDVQLVEVARRYALGTPAAIVAGSFPPVAQQLVEAHNKRAVLLGGVAPSTSLSGGAATTVALVGVDESMVVVDASLDSQRSIVIGILMAGCTSHGARMACVQARARCDVARALNAPSEAIAARDPLDVLNVLVRAGRARLALAEAWVACHALDAERVAHILARAYIAAHRRYNPRVRAAAAAAAAESPLAAPAASQPPAADSGAAPLKKSGALASVRRALFGGRREVTNDEAAASTRASADALVDEPAARAAAASFDGARESTSPVSPSEADLASSR
jgi:hypothetical protein